MFVEVFKELSELLNFTYTVTIPPDGEWGSMKDDGTWSGMVGQLETKIVDIGGLNYYYLSVYFFKFSEFVQLNTHSNLNIC